MINDHGIKLEHILDRTAGSYLKTVRYQSQRNLICPQCGGFKSSAYNLCWACHSIVTEARNQHLEQFLADRIAMGIYAPDPGSQTLKMMYGYKEPNPPEPYTRTVLTILALAVDGHRECLNEVSGLDLTGWAMVPSSTSSKRYGKPHPLHAIIKQVLPDVPEVRLQSHNDKRHGFDPEAFTLTDGQDRTHLTGNMLLIDDSWVTGGNAQSAAVCLKRAGAAQVSIYCISRIVNLNYLATIGSQDAVSSFNANVRYINGYCPWHQCKETTQQ